MKPFHKAYIFIMVPYIILCTMKTADLANYHKLTKVSSVKISF